MSAAFFDQALEQAEARGLLSKDHFTMDGTLVEAWASLKSCQRTDGSGDTPPPPNDPGNATVDFHGEKRCNETHEFKNDQEAKLIRKGNNKEAKLSLVGHVLTESRNGLVADVYLTQEMGTAEREAAAEMLARRKHAGRISVGADKAYDTKAFAAPLGAHDAMSLWPRMPRTREAPSMGGLHDTPATR